MTARFTTDTPLASATSWAGRQDSTRATVKSIATSEAEINASLALHAKETAAREAQIDAIWRGNRARRDADAAAYGEPETPHEFYAGRPGAKAEKIVLDCLCALQEIPEVDRLYADQLMDVISREYLDAAPDEKTGIRRAWALLRISRRGKKA